MYCVYMHVNRTNQKKYIGITKQQPKNRWGSNGHKYKESPHFWAAIQKYGWDTFYHVVIMDGLSKEVACETERALIKVYSTQNPKYGYNVYEGGEAPIIPDAVKIKMSESAKLRPPQPGRPCSREKAKKISDAQKGRKLTEEHKKKLSAAKRGKTHKPPSEETRRKISNSHKKKRVYCAEMDKVFESIQQCARECNLDATAICANCKGRIKGIHGLHFSYYDDAINA